MRWNSVRSVSTQQEIDLRPGDETKEVERNKEKMTKRRSLPE
jgi:hypothetical protein